MIKTTQQFFQLNFRTKLNKLRDTDRAINSIIKLHQQNNGTAMKKMRFLK